MSAKQREVLAWVAAGCPAREWPDESHKHSARALQSRGLVAVGRKGGRWRATITVDGEHFLANGAYPEEPESDLTLQPRLPRQRTVQPDSTSRARPAPTASEPQRPPGSDRRERAEEIIGKLLEVGGPLELSDSEVGWTAHEIEVAARAASNRPRDQRLRLQSHGPWGPRRATAFLEHDFAVDIERGEVPVPARLVRPDAPVAAYRNDSDRHEVSRASLGRACRVLQALAAECRRRGHSMQSVNSGARYHAEFRRSLGEGQVALVVGASTFNLRIREAAGKGASRLPVRYGRERPRWLEVRGYEFVPTGRLKLSITSHAAPRDGRPVEFQDTKTRQLEDVLPDLLREVEVRALEDARARERRDQAEREKRQRWETAMEEAKRKLTTSHRTDALLTQARRWADAATARQYVTAMRERVAEMENGSTDREVAEEWLVWCRKHVAELDPLQQALCLPDPPRPTAENMAPYLGDWGFYGPG